MPLICRERIGKSLSPSLSVSKKSTCCCSTLRLLAVLPPSGFSDETALFALGSSGCLICFWKGVMMRENYFVSSMGF